ATIIIRAWPVRKAGLTPDKSGGRPFPDHAPSQITAGGRSHVRQSYRIKEAGELRKQERPSGASPEALQPIDIPVKFVSGRWRIGFLAEPRLLKTAYEAAR